MQSNNECNAVEDELRAQLEALCETLGQKDHELEMLKSEAESVKAELENAKGTAATQVSSLEKQLEKAQLRGGLEMFRALEALHSEHKQALEKEATRMEAWVRDLKDSHHTEKSYLLERIAQLEKDHAGNGAKGDASRGANVDSVEGEDPASMDHEVLREGYGLSDSMTGMELSYDVRPIPVVHSTSVGIPTDPVTVSTLAVPVALSAVLTVSGTVSVPTVSGSVSAPIVLGIVSAATTGLSPVTISAANTGLHVVPVAGFEATRVTPLTVSSPTSAVVSIPSITGGTVLSPTASVFTPGTSIPTMSMGGRPSDASLMETVTRLIQAQTEAMTAQAKAVALHHLPTLPCFTGEGTETQEGGFERWIERFRERAQFTGWSPEEQLYQLKSHLNKTAQEVFRMLPNSDKKDIKSTVEALRNRFKPKDIEELRWLEFHHLTQGTESIEQLGIHIQQLGQKAFLPLLVKNLTGC